MQVYARDDFGRDVSVVTTADGTNLNLHLARQGFVNDRYLQRFRAENPALAAELDVAFATAKAERVGLWGACGSTGSAAAAKVPTPPAAPAAPLPVVAQKAPQGSCHSAYSTCVPVKGDGSGRGEINDLDCPDIGRTVQVKSVGVDPYRLDADSDGAGCE